MELESEQMDEYSNRPPEGFGFYPRSERKTAFLGILNKREDATEHPKVEDSQIDSHDDFLAAPPPVEPMTDEDFEITFEPPYPHPTVITSDTPIEDSVATVFESDADSADEDNIIIEDMPEKPFSLYTKEEEDTSEEITVEFSQPTRIEYKLDTPQARLKYWIENSFEDVEEFCRVAEIKKTSFYEYFSAYSPLLAGSLSNKMDRLGLNLDWYRTGKGAMFKELTQPATEAESSRKFSVRKKGGSNKDLNNITKNADRDESKTDLVKKDKGKKIRNKKIKDKKIKNMTMKTNSKASKKPVVYDLNTPQGRLKKWINDKYESVTEFSKVFGSKPSAIYNHTCTDGFLYKKENLKKLEEMGLDINWYLGSAVNEAITQQSEEPIKEIIGIDPIVNVVVETASAPNNTKRPYVKKTPAPQPQITPAPAQSFGTMLTEYETQEIKLLQEKERIDTELAKIQAIKLHLSELNKLLNI